MPQFIYCTDIISCLCATGEPRRHRLPICAYSAGKIFQDIIISFTPLICARPYTTVLTYAVIVTFFLFWVYIPNNFYDLLFIPFARKRPLVTLSDTGWCHFRPEHLGLMYCNPQPLQRAIMYRSLPSSKNGVIAIILLPFCSHFTCLLPMYCC